MTEETVLRAAARGRPKRDQAADMCIPGHEAGIDAMSLCNHVAHKDGTLDGIG